MAASNPTSSDEIFSVNPYENHPSLTQIEAEVLWEYAKLNQHVKDVRTPLLTHPPSSLIERAFHSWSSKHAL
jgi:DASH complex subunit DAD3